MSGVATILAGTDADLNQVVRSSQKLHSLLLIPVTTVITSATNSVQTLVPPITIASPPCEQPYSYEDNSPISPADG